MGEQPNLVHLIRRIIQEEIQCIIAPVVGLEPKLQTMETIVKEEIKNALSPISSKPSGWTEVRSKHRIDLSIPPQPEDQHLPWKSSGEGRPLWSSWARGALLL